ncbi:MAG: Rrf2 family transcriptional regulator [Deinococcota bacterium]
MNSQFAVAVHTLTALAVSGNQRVTSEQIGESVNTNPSFIRRVLKHLRAAHLVTSRSGVGGGLQLTKAPEDISLKMVYTAMRTTDLFPLHTNTNPDCPVGNNIAPVLAHRFADAEADMLESLAKVSIADIARDVLTRYQNV